MAKKYRKFLNGPRTRRWDKDRTQPTPTMPFSQLKEIRGKEILDTDSPEQELLRWVRDALAPETEVRIPLPRAIGHLHIVV